MLESPKSENILNYYGAYPCPVCRHGEITQLPLMEAFGCNFCRHIFTANEEQQTLSMADSQLSLTWYWTGQAWKGVPREGTEGKWVYGIAAVIFVSLPTLIVSLATYFFPPIPNSPLSWLPMVWSIVTFLAHLTCIIWLVIEYYQFPFIMYFRALFRRMRMPFR
jgi:hypothetical protein